MTLDERFTLFLATAVVAGLLAERLLRWWRS